MFRVRNKIYPRFVVSVFLILLCTTLFCAPIAVFSLRFLSIKGSSPWTPFVPFLPIIAASILIGTLLGAITGKTILAPILKIRDATKRVARGDYNVQVPNEADGEISELIDNFNAMVVALQSTETLRSDFVANVSHEFKTPLASIQGYATLLQDEDMEKAERQECIEKILLSVRQLSSTITNVLSLSRLETQDVPKIKTPIDLDEQLRQSILMLESKWEAKAMVLEIDLEPVRYMGNPELLSEVWVNLIDNAIKYSSSGGKLQVSLVQSANGPIVTVCDEGEGIDSEVCQHIFEKFYQGDTTHRSPGNGLGLALVKKILDLEGGRISVKSTLGEGSSFKVWLPGLTALP